MSLINQLNAATEYHWNNVEPVDILSVASPLLWKLMGNALRDDSWEVRTHELVDGGLMIKVPLEHDSSNKGGYGAATVIEQSKKDILDAARFRWAGAYGSNTLNLDDLTQNVGAEAVVSLVNQYMKSIKKAVRLQMAEDVISAAADTTRINGLGDLFSTVTATEYGSIAEDNMANWAAKVITTSENISFSVLQKIFREPAMGTFKGALPDFCVTTQVLLDGYETSLQPNQRYSDTAMVEAGWANLLHKGATISADTGISSGYFYALNSLYLKLKTHSKYNFTTPVWNAKTVLGQPDVITADSRWRGNLICSNRKMQVLHTGLTVA
jgi:hypothetical protein